MLKYDHQIIINKPLTEVVALFVSRKLMPSWQPGLVSDELMPNKGRGLNRKLTFRIGKRNISFIETVLTDNLPDEYRVSYKWKGIKNVIVNSFHESGHNQTLWKSESEFRFSGLMRLISIFMKKGFEQQSQIMMKNFKRFAERAI